MDGVADFHSEADLNVALGLAVPPPQFNYVEFESNAERQCVDESDSDVGGNESDVVIVRIIEKGSGNKASSSKVVIEEDLPFPEQKTGKFDVDDGKPVDDKDVPSKDSKKNEECDVDGNEVPLKDSEKKDVDRKDDNEVPLTDSEKENVDKKDDEDGEMKMKTPKSEIDGDVTDRRSVALKSFQLEEKLKVGTEFPDLEKVYLLFCEYARYKGFSVRKGEQRYFGKSTTIRWKEFICSCTGLPNDHSSNRKVAVYKKLVIRSDCKARLIVSRVDMGSFVVSFFEKDHNHVLVEPDQTFLLRSSRNMNYAKKSVMEALNSAGIGVTSAFKFMAKETGGV